MSIKKTGKLFLCHHETSKLIKAKYIFILERKKKSRYGEKRMILFCLPIFISSSCDHWIQCQWHTFNTEKCAQYFIFLCELSHIYVLFIRFFLYCSMSITSIAHMFAERQLNYIFFVCSPFQVHWKVIRRHCGNFTSVCCFRDTRCFCVQFEIEHYYFCI